MLEAKVQTAGRCFAMKETGLERVGRIGKLETFGSVLQDVGCLLLVTSWGSDKDAWAKSGVGDENSGAGQRAPAAVP